MVHGLCEFREELGTTREEDQRMRASKVRRKPAPGRNRDGWILDGITEDEAGRQIERLQDCRTRRIVRKFGKCGARELAAQPVQRFRFRRSSGDRLKLPDDRKFDLPTLAVSRAPAENNFVGLDGAKATVKADKPETLKGAELRLLVNASATCPR